MAKTNEGVMKVLFFIDGLIAGGKERRLVELMRGIKSGFDIEFELVLMNNEVHYRQVFELGIQIHYLIRRTRKDLSIFNKFYKICKKFKPDIIHCWDSMTAIYSIPASRLLNIKLINGMVADAPGNYNFFNRFWPRTKLTFFFSNIIIGNSKAGLKAYSAPTEKSICIYNGFDFKRKRNTKDPSEVKKRFNINSSFVVLMVGTFGDRKDYDTFMEAAKMLCKKRKDVEFIAVGDGKNFERLSRKAGEDLNGSIKMLGRQTDVESIINACDVCVLTTNAKVHGEGISNSILEYMAFAKPVIASWGGGTNEIVEDSKTGFLIEPFHTADLVKKIEIFLNDSELRKNFGKTGEERVKTIFSIDNMVNEYISVYESVIKNNFALGKN